MQQNQRHNSGVRPLLLMMGKLMLLSLFACFFAAPASLQAQTGTIPIQWQILPPLRSGVGDPGLALLNGKIHVVGGTEYFGSSGFHEAFDPVNQRWESLPDLPQQVSNAALAVVDDTLYVMGGYNILEGGALPDTYIYEPESKSWLTAAAMISPTSGAGVAVINDAIYIFGGYDNVAESRLVQRYDPIDDEWTLVSPMPVGRSEFGLVTADGLVYVIGGNIRVATTRGELSTRTMYPRLSKQMAATLSTSVAVYDPVRDTWRDLAALPTPRISMAAAVLQGQIYVIGGTDAWVGGTVQNSTYVYNLATNQWASLPPMSTPRSGVRAVPFGDLIYVLGGYDQLNTPLPTHEAFGLAVQQLYLPVIYR